MAFRQPQHRPQTSRQLPFPALPDPSDVAVAVASPPRKRPLEQSEEWVLFEPGTAQSVTDKTHTTSTQRTPRTAGLSRLSDFGSLDTAARSDQNDDVTEHGSEPDEEADLDSLDDGLHAFHESSEYNSPIRPRLDQTGGAVLPTHDGLGSFGVNSAAMQQHLWQFEQPYAPKRKVRRTSSVQRTLEALEDAELGQEAERMRRIERWRLEQSRALLGEIERETRRMRRISRVSATRARTDSVTNVKTQSDTKSIHEVNLAASEATQTGQNDERRGSEEAISFWQKFTQRVIRDLIGIDENILSIIFGESLPADAESTPSTNQSQPSIENVVSIENREAHVPIEQTWQHRLLARIARELGILVHQLSEHPGAFSTYLRTQETPAYAGLPNTTMPAYGSSSDPTTYGFGMQSTSSPADVTFAPTLPTQPHSEAALWGIEEESDEMGGHLRADGANNMAQDREYWERELDVKMVFNFLKSRFSPRPASPTLSDTQRTVAGLSLPTDGSDAASDARRASVFSHTPSAPSAPHSARRAALIRQHHPLTSSRNLDSSNRRRDSLAHRHHLHHHHSQPSVAAAAVLRSRIAARTASSCASQSTKKSLRSGSSRNYWDIGGSGGTGPAGAVGAWGEVGI